MVKQQTIITMNNLILLANNGLKTKFDASVVRFKKTFKEAEKLGVDLNNTTQYFKRDGIVWKVSFVSGRLPKRLGGKYFEMIQLYPELTLRKR